MVKKLHNVQESINKVMYYSENIITPENPKWNYLSNEKQEWMKSKMEEFEKWRNYPRLFGFLSYCVLTQCLSIVVSVLISLFIIFLFTILFTIWINKGLSMIISKIQTFLIVCGFIYIAFWVEKEFFTIILTILGLFTVYLLGFFIRLATRTQVWSFIFKKYLEI